MSENVSRKDFSFIETPAGRKSAHQLCGWSGIEKPDMMREAFDMIGFPRLKIIGAAPITAGTRMMIWEVGRKVIGKDTPNYAQEIGDPFSVGTKVLMADGSEKNIEDIQIGDMVVNHKNELAKVTNTIKKKFTGNMVTIHLRGWHRSLTATETHHGMILL